MLLSIQIILLTLIVFVILYLALNYFVKGEKCVCIVVLGDIGRSPRMQYHALSFARHGYFVNIVGYEGSVPHKQLMNNEKIEINAISEAPKIFAYLPSLVEYVMKVLWVSASLTFTLLLLPKSKYFLLQNPPTIPAFVVAWFVSLVRHSLVVIDWHNYGYSILALKLGQHHLLVSLSHWVERVFGRFAWANICVTDAMRKDLAKYWNIKALTVYDRPPDIFQSTPLEEQHKLFKCLANDYPVFQARPPSEYATAFTQLSSDGTVVKSDGRPALLVSSTSWTDDEDFGLLLTALEDYENDAIITDAPNIVCVITGKGPQKEMYRQKIEARKWKKVCFCLPWLTAEDYPLLLGSSDIGVCLHTSSSGLDLPMKVVDMFGCGLPVCAVKYNCIDELVKHEENGLLFTDSHQLLQQLKDLLNGFPDKSTKLQMFRGNLKTFQLHRWHEQWTDRVLPLFTESDRTR